MVRSNHEQPYRERALKLFPWICAHCGREFDEFFALPFLKLVET